MEVSCVVTSVRYVSQSCLHTHTLGHSPTQRDTVRETETGWSRGGGGRRRKKIFGKAWNVVKQLLVVHWLVLRWSRPLLGI